MLDLRKLRFLDSTGLHLLLDWTAKARAGGHDLSLIPGPPAVQRVIEVAGIGQQLTFASNGVGHRAA